MPKQEDLRVEGVLAEAADWWLFRNKSIHFITSGDEGGDRGEEWEKAEADWHAEWVEGGEVEEVIAWLNFVGLGMRWKGI